MSLIHGNAADPRLVPISQDSGLVFGMISSLWKSVQDESIPDEFLYAVPRNAEILLLALGQLPLGHVAVPSNNVEIDEAMTRAEDEHVDENNSIKGYLTPQL